MPQSVANNAAYKCELHANGTTVVTGQIPKTEPNIYSADETAGVSIDMETSVSSDDTLQSSKFTDTIHKVSIQTKP